MPGVTANANPPTQGSKYRIKVGQTIGALVWSNIATTVKGFWTIIYDDGSPDYWPMVETASGSSRATVLVPTAQVAKKNGWVVDGYVGVNTPTVPQRGQVYVQVIIVDPNLSVTSAVIACGYSYAGHLVNIGTFVEPGPAGGHGAITRASLGSTAISAPGIALAAVPTGAFWRWIFGKIIYTATATVGTRNVQPTFRDASARVFKEMQAAAPTASQLLEISFGPNLTSEATSALPGGNVTREEPSPDRHLPAAYDIFIDDVGNIDNADTVFLEAQVEEWVMPN